MSEPIAGMSVGKIVAIALIIIATVLVGVALGVAAYHPERVGQLVGQLAPAPSTAWQAASSATGEGAVGSGVADVDSPGTGSAPDADGGDDAQAAPVSPVSPDKTPTYQVAAFGDIPIYSPIAQEHITGVLFHQASFESGLVMTTELPEVSEEGLGTENPVRVNNAQTQGVWCDADALHLYRVTDATQMDTSIDIGAPWGTVVHAPVTGTVVLVKDYDLYGYVPDVQIHIQPEGHPELDLVLLHQYDPMVKAGDHVEGGVTPLAHVRDIAADLTDIQLGFYTAGDDPGNHSHVQMNNADFPGYREESLKDAYQVSQ